MVMWPGLDGPAVLLIDASAFLAEAELLKLDLASIADREHIDRLKMPFKHLLHTVDHALRAYFGCPTEGAVDAKRRMTVRPCP